MQSTEMGGYTDLKLSRPPTTTTTARLVRMRISSQPKRTVFEIRMRTLVISTFRNGYTTPATRAGEGAHSYSDWQAADVPPFKISIIPGNMFNLVSR